MSPEEREKMDALCKSLTIERDPEIFDRLVRELNDLLGEKQTRIHSEHQTTSQ